MTTLPSVFLIHAHPSAIKAYADALGVPVERIHVIQSRTSQFSAGYDTGSGIAKDYPKLSDYTRSRLPKMPYTDPVVLIGFSAGCWLVRNWLRDMDTRIRCIAAVLVDGLHAGGSDKKVSLSAAHEGVLDFARMALEHPDLHRLVITHSQIVPPGYASTRATADAVLQALQLQPRPSTLTSYQTGGLFIEAEQGGAASDHSRQLLEVGPRACKWHVATMGAWQEVARGGQPPATPAADADAPILDENTLPAGPRLGGTLGERAVEWCLREASQYPCPSAARKALYLAGCERGGKRLGLKAGNHCAAAQSAAAFMVARAGEETVPHAWRAGAKELMADARTQGAWLPVAAVKSGAERPSPGDLAIYDRSDPKRPETAWWGHVDRVVAVEADRYRAIGANEGPKGEWRDEWTAFAHPRILGFVRYPAAEAAPLTLEPPPPPPRVADNMLASLDTPPGSETEATPVFADWRTEEWIAARDRSVSERS